MTLRLVVVELSTFGLVSLQEAYATAMLGVVNAHHRRAIMYFHILSCQVKLFGMDSRVILSAESISLVSSNTPTLGVDSPRCRAGTVYRVFSDLQQMQRRDHAPMKRSVSVR